MLKSEFYLAALNAGLYKRKDWIISAFSLIQEDLEAWKKEPYAYRIVHTPSGMFFVDPALKEHALHGELVKIDDAPANQAIFEFKEKLQIKAGEVPNLRKNITSTYGNALVNWLVFVYPFGNIIEYQTGKITARGSEKLILPLFVDNPKEGEARSPEKIYVDQYLKFTEGMFFLTGLTQLCVPAGSRKSMTAPDGIVELRNRLVKENEGHLNDPTVVAKIEKALVDHDKNVWMKGDPAADFLINDKSYNVVRKKLYLSIGADAGLDDKVGVDYIQNSLSEGWDISKFPTMNNNLRAGVFGRSAQTMLGGESVKWLLRASSNMSVTAENCLTKLGLPTEITDDPARWIGLNVVTPDGAHEKITHDTFEKYLGKVVNLRSPMFCKMPKTDYCSVCVGDKLSVNPTALSAAVAEYGNAFLGIFMSAAHGKALLVAKMNFKTAIQ